MGRSDAPTPTPMPTSAWPSHPPCEQPLPHERVETWADTLMQLARTTSLVRDVRVLASTGSTQDAAASACAGRPGLVVMTDRQTKGRGRFARRWHQTGAEQPHVQHGPERSEPVQRDSQQQDGAVDAGLGLALSVTLDAALQPVRVVTAAAIAACRCARALLPTESLLGLKLPNDVLEVGTGRKLAGVLLEPGPGVWILGVGVNVWQQPHHFEQGLHAASLAVLAAPTRLAPTARIDLAAGVLAELDALLAEPLEALADAWHRWDALAGRTIDARASTQAGFVELLAARVQRACPFGGVLLEHASGPMRVDASRLELTAIQGWPGWRPSVPPPN